MNQKQQHAIEYLREENRVLREQLGTRRLRFTDDQRRRLATKAKLADRFPARFEVADRIFIFVHIDGIAHLSRPGVGVVSFQRECVDG